MATYVPPKKNAAFVLYLSLPSYATLGRFQANPTLASGDVTISKDGGAFANVTNLPTATPGSGRSVLLSLTSTEMDADNIIVLFVDQTATPEWVDTMVEIQTSVITNDDLNTLVLDLPTNAELDTALGTADDAVLAAIAALNDPTASEIADEVATRTIDANIVQVNDINITGVGSEDNPWGP